MMRRMRLREGAGVMAGQLGRVKIVKIRAWACDERAATGLMEGPGRRTEDGS